MNQKDLNYTAAESSNEQAPFTDGPFTDDPAVGGSFSEGSFSEESFSEESFSEGSLNGGPFSQAPASREISGSGVPQMSGALEEDMPVEEAFARLEQLIRRMESEDISLEDSFACYEQGIRLVRYCNERIDQVEKKVQIQLQEQVEKSR